MKPKINLRLCIAGTETLIPLFKECLKSYLRYLEIDELLIYTTKNLIDEVDEIISGKADEITIFDIDEFYTKHYNRFSKNVKDVLDYAKYKNYKKDLSLFYLRMRWIMDYYIINGEKPFIFSDIDVIMFENIKPIVDWIGSDYLLYNASPDDLPKYNQIIVEKVGKDFFKKIPKFNYGWMCIPKGIVINIDEVCKYLKYEIGSGIGEETAASIVLAKNNIRTKVLPRDLMIVGDLNFKNKTLCHLGPYGLNLDILREWGLYEKKRNL